ncbi:MAG TPA: tyrosine-type recombinase/integrase [Ktedonobacterales bacterium]|nr:tyrosine-type recombinase/integrase [Ktedonobacterales bacterium]
MTQKTQPILMAEEIGDIVVSLNPRTETGARDQALFLLLLDTGMRAGEVCGLRLQDTHLDEGYAIVLGKGRKQRPVKIGARAGKAVRFYLLHWRRPTLPHEEHVFLTCRGVSNAGDAFASAGGEPLTVNALDQIFRRIGRQAGVERLHPHLLRHTFACMHLLRYRDPFGLKSLLGHTTLQMTNHYCEAVQQMDVVRADTTSVVDGIDTKALDVNRRGRLARNGKRMAR